MMLTVEEAETVESFTLVAVTVAVESWVTVGAVKTPSASIVPGVAPLAAQVTPSELLPTVAVNCRV